MNETVFNRRALLGAGVLAGGAALAVPAWLRAPEPVAVTPSLPPITFAPPTTARIAVSETRLALRCVHTGHRCDALVKRGEDFDPQGVAELDAAMRDWRTREVTTMDRDLLVLLARLRDSLDLPADTAFDLISGYRSPATNAALGAHSHAVASKSQHMLGKAADIALPGIDTSRIRRAALHLRAGGVGHYPQDGFVHIDTGRVRFW